MSVLDQLLTLENVMLCFAVVALVWVQRKGIEEIAKRFGKDLTKYEVWEHFFVPLAPLGTGMLVSLIPTLPIPEMFASGMSARAVFGIGLGLISGLVYRLVKKMIFDKAGKVDEETDFLDE